MYFENVNSKHIAMNIHDISSFRGLISLGSIWVYLYRPTSSDQLRSIHGKPVKKNQLTNKYFWKPWFIFSL